LGVTLMLMDDLMYLATHRSAKSAALRSMDVGWLLVSGLRR
jgi:hypothetical protein